MNTPTRLSLYGLGLLTTFGAAFLVAGAVVPDTAVQARADATMNMEDGGQEMDMSNNTDATSVTGTATSLPGLSIAAGGFQLSSVSAPSGIGEEGTLSFSILDTNGAAVTEFTEEHEKELHLIVVRSDGTEFRHVHPSLDTSGTWSLPWSWTEAGNYRVFADFTPSATGESLTLTQSVDIGGAYQPARVQGDVREARVGEFDVRLIGDLVVGGSSSLTLEVTRDGTPVTQLQPYLGAFGHLVALREGDLAYLHVHPEGDEPKPGDSSGPTVDFMTVTPTSGRYLLYFDFQVGDTVYSAPFSLTTLASAEANPPSTN